MKFGPPPRLTTSKRPFVVKVNSGAALPDSRPRSPEQVLEPGAEVVLVERFHSIENVELFAGECHQFAVAGILDHSRDRLPHNDMLVLLQQLGMGGTVAERAGLGRGFARSQQSSED
jgi:hypothetical protein